MADNDKDLVYEVLINLQVGRITKMLEEIKDEVEELKNLIGDNGDGSVGGKRVG